MPDDRAKLPEIPRWWRKLIGAWVNRSRTWTQAQRRQRVFVALCITSRELRRIETAHHA